MEIVIQKKLRFNNLILNSKVQVVKQKTVSLYKTLPTTTPKLTTEPVGKNKVRDRNLHSASFSSTMRQGS